MHFYATTSAMIALLSAIGVVASPTLTISKSPALTISKSPALKISKRQGFASVDIYGQGACAGDATTVFANAGSGAGGGTFECFQITQGTGQSVRANGAGCVTTTWSDTNCEGSSFVIPDSDCHTFAFSSVSVGNCAT